MKGQGWSGSCVPWPLARTGLWLLGWVALVACSDASAPAQEPLPAPTDLDDGWAVAPPASVDLDDGVLTSVAHRVAGGEFGEVHALLVARHGTLVYERYFRDYDGREPHTLQSVTKSVNSALIGLALERGEIESLDLTLGELFPDYQDVFDAAPGKADIRIRNLLTMQSGLAWSESAPFSDDANDAGAMLRSEDWVRYALEQPLTSQPGTAWVYNSGASILLSAILRRTSGKDAIEYAEADLFGPLGIQDFVWYRNPVDGLPHTGGGLRLLPRDLARFGQLYLEGGVWEGEQVLPASWVEASGQARVTVGSYGYGYQWWTKELRGVAGHTPRRDDVLFGWGFGGQHVFISPELDLVVVVNAWNEDGSSQGPRLFDELMEAVGS